MYNRPVLEHMEGSCGGHCVIPNLIFVRGTKIEEFVTQVNDVEIEIEGKEK